MDSLSLYLPGILLAYGAFFIGIASPGPNVLAVIGTSMSLGRKSGIALALGAAGGCDIFKVWPLARRWRERWKGLQGESNK